MIEIVIIVFGFPVAVLLYFVAWTVVKEAILKFK